MSCGIYKIENLINGKVYIGQSKDILKRWRIHRCCRSERSHYPLYRAFAKYGLENFSFEILEECDSSLLNAKEEYWGTQFDCYVPNGYNQAKFGNSQSVPQKLSVKLVEEIKERLILREEITRQELAEEYGVTIDTIRDINVGRTWFDSSLTYPLNPSKYSAMHNHLVEKDFKKCIDCGIQISSGSTGRCSQCQGISTRIIERPSAEQLEKELRESNFTQVGKKYEVSDNAIRKWCKTYGMSTSSKDYK